MRRKLAVLRYPGTQRLFKGGNSSEFPFEEFQKIVVWLEEETIRFYTPDERQKLRDIADKKSWAKHLLEYCKRLELDAVGFNLNIDADRKYILDRLISVAVQEVYHDHVEDGSLLFAGRETPLSAETNKWTDEARIDFISKLNVLLGKLQLPLLNASANMDEILSALNLINVRGHATATGNNAKMADFLNLPVAINSTPKNIRDAVTVLRLLHGNKLRDVQSAINSSINDLQAITANPKTDLTKGKTGS